MQITFHFSLLLITSNGTKALFSEEIKVKVPKTYAFGTLEAPPRFELGHKGFAGLCLTTWLWCREKNGHNVEYKVPDGADYETRTRYLHLGKVALYQMS